jgi:hypothetical protein
MRSGRALRELVMKHKVEVEFDDFGWTVLKETAEREGVAVDELIVHAAMYYLADQDGKRVSRRPFSSEAQRARRQQSADTRTPQ